MKRLLKQTLGIMICLTLILGSVSTVFAVGDFEECCYCGETVHVDDLCDCGGCGDITTACWAENHCEECGLCLEGEDFCLDCAPEIEFPIEFDGSSLVGIKEPKGIEGGVSNGESYYHCDGSCGLENAWLSNIWVDTTYYEPVTEFVDGEQYIFQIMIHPEHGYKLPVNLGEEVGINVTGVEWEDIDHDFYAPGNIYYAEFYITYNAETGIPAEKVVDLPIVIDGSELVGITEPTGITSLPTGDTFEYCDGSCDNWYISNKWFIDGTTNEATEFVDGQEYYFQISIHPEEGYRLPDDLNLDEFIKVEGVEWDSIEGGNNTSLNVYYEEFHIVYNAETGIPAPDKEVEFPIVIDGSELAGITEPTGIANLPESEEYYHCDASCGLGEYWISNIWVDYNYEPVTEFVDGKGYIYQITIHAKDGYKFPDKIDRYEAFAVTGVEWDNVNCDISSSYDNVAYADFYIIYNAETGIPAEKVVDLPIVIDGSELAGTTVPTSISSLPTGDTFEYCDGACSDERYAANAWFDADDNPVDEFVAGYDYYYQISIHPTEGYHFPIDVKNLEGIKVEGIVWDDVDYYYYAEKDLYYATFWIFYDELVGIPGVEVDTDTDTETDTEVDTETESDTDTDTEEEPYVKGDVNKDGVLDIIDVVMARAHVVKTRPLTDEQIVIGDMNDDGMIDIIDVVMMRSAIVNG